MITRNNFKGARARMGRWPLLGVTAALVVAAAACDTESLVNLDDPDLITLPVVEDTANVELVRNGVLFEFGRAYAGPASSNQSPGIVGLSGVMSDEMWYASTFQTMRDIDERNILVENTSLEDVYQYLHRARNLAEQAAELYSISPRAGSPDQALVTNLAGYTYVFFGENFCSGVPFSQASLGGELTYGPGVSDEEALERAITRFEEAIDIAEAAGATDQVHLAQVGIARALQNLGRFDEAAAVAAEVPADFQYDVTYSEAAVDPNNGIWFEINSNGRSSVASNEGENGLEFFARGETPEEDPAPDLWTEDRNTNTIDPRAPADSVGFGIGTSIPRYAQGKYDTRGADIPLATGLEARLIEAEALLDGGNSDAYLTILNDLRDEAGMGTLSDPGTADGRVLQLYEERAFWLWLTAHRLGDLRRLIEFYGFTEDEVFPIGTTIFGTPYGDDVNLPIPQIEENNPEYSGQCIDRDA